MWLVSAVFSAFFAGITSILAKIGLKDVNSNVVTAIRCIVILVFSWMIVFWTQAHKEIYEISVKTYIFLILSGLSTGGAWIMYFKALQLGNVNKVTPIDKSSTLFAMIFAFIFLGEEVDTVKIMSMILIGIGTYMMITTKTDSSQNKKGWFAAAMLSAVFSALTSIFGKIGIEGLDSNLGTAIRTIIVLIMAWTVVFMRKETEEIKNIDSKSMLFIVLSGITTGLSWLFFYNALQKGPVSIVQPIDKLSIVVTILFSYIVLGEKLSKKSFIGFILLVVGTLSLLL